MSAISGIFVSLRTGDAWWAGTNDHLYLGVVGTVGGREFALDVAGFDDFEEGTTVTYSIGESARVFGGRRPATAADALESMTICLPNVTHVYVRKQGDRTHDGDDAWALAHVFVYLIAPGENTRIYESTGPAVLSNESGSQVWLAEFTHGGYRNARIPIDGIAACAD